jgi:hypothetical protein
MTPITSVLGFLSLTLSSVQSSDPLLPREILNRDVCGFSTHKGRQQHHMQTEWTTYRLGAKHNENNGITHGKQHNNTQAATV